MSDSKKESLWTLFLTFAKVGVMTFGGGYAMLPILEREVVNNHDWATSDELMDYYAVGQCTPGVIAVNVSTFIGYKTRGILGGIVATLGVVFPSVVIITLLASVLKAFQSNPYVAKAFAGIRIAVCALLLTAVIKLIKKAVTNVTTAVIAVVSLLLEILLGLSPVIIVASCIIIGVCAYFFAKKNENKEVKE
ncbi:MAG: chromate transporter [Sphaerochaetaceae bacterium]|nr:chromate transporter [Sphaerochaetaceae bacterium]